MRTTIIIAIALTLGALNGCSDDSDNTPPDGGTLDHSAAPGDGAVDRAPLPDVAPIPDGFGPLPACAVPGTPCTLDNPCAINPVCGADRVCRPTKIQSCDDGLSCTDDSCKGLGQCEHKPKVGSCVLPTGTETITLKCFADGEPSPEDPCQRCAPATDAYRWSPANGGPCDDGNLCTKDDSCVEGTCKGTYFGDTCDDGLDCTEDKCDGQGACLGSVRKSGWCLINGACYKEGENDPSGACQKCVTAKSPSSWSPITDSCQIGGVCYANGDLHPQGCAKCDTAVSTTAWTVTSGCLINGVCAKAGDTDPSGCSSCDPASSTSSWTPLPKTCIIGPLICAADGDLHPEGCAKCDTAVSTSGWTVTSGCLINGMCAKTGDKDPSQCSSCDPASSTTDWTPLPNTCVIDPLTCAANGDLHPQGCAKCDVATSTSSWTPLAGKCLIDNICYDSGKTDSSGCGVCDPTQSSTSWSAVAQKCLIGGACYGDGVSHPSAGACLACDATTNPTGWTAVGTAQLVSHDFDSGGTTGWTLTNSDTSVGWQLSTKRSAAGGTALYYGNPATGNFDSGAANNGTAEMPAVTLTAGKAAALSFQLWMDTESSSSYDKLSVKLKGSSTALWQKSNITMKTWQEVVVDLTSLAGQTVTLVFEFDTNDSINNKGEGAYIDSIVLYHGC